MADSGAGEGDHRRELSVPETAAIVYVRYTQLARDEQISFSRVESRMLSWCKSGRGEIRVNGQLFQAGADEYMFLPWGHRIEYHADKRDPMLLGGIHVIPDYSVDHPIEYWVAHNPEDPLANCPWRRDAPLPELDNIVTGNFSQNESLRHLAEYIVHRMLYFERDDATSRLLGRMLLSEVYRTLGFVIPATYSIPVGLQRILRFIMDHLHKKIGLRELAEFSGLSRATVGRLFNQYLECTPVEWIAQRRIMHAQRLLTSTRIPVAEVGSRVGIDDPYYFSKLFKRKCGVAPLTYRKRGGLL